MPTYRVEARYSRTGMAAEAGQAAREWLRTYPGGDVTRITRNGPQGTEFLIGFELFSGSLIMVNAVVRGLSLTGMVIEHLWQRQLLTLPADMSGPDQMQPTSVRCAVIA